MKKALILCLILLCGFAVGAQSVDSALRYRISTSSFNQAMDYFIANAAASVDDTGEEKASGVLERKKQWAGSRISYDVSLGGDIAVPMGTALATYMAHYSDYCPGAGYTGNWKCLGPFTDYYNVTADYPGNCENQGRIDAIWAPPIPDTMTLLVGSNGGGLWKTNNGGRNWRNLTDGAMGTASSVIGIGGVHSIAVNPSDTNMIYIAVGGPDQSKKSYQYGLGLAYTTNGGATWYTDNTFNSMISGSEIPRVTKVAYMPGTTALFAISKDKILCKPSPSSSWTNITPDTIAAGGYWCTDLEFSKATPGTLVVSTSALNGKSSLWCYNSGSWTRVIITLPSPYTQESWQDGHTFSDGVKMFSVSGTDYAYVWVTAHNGSARASLFLKTPLSSYSPTLLNYNFPGTSPSDITDFEVSGNQNIIYATNYYYFGTGSDKYPASLVRSTDEGVTFKPFASTGHPDGRCLYIQHSLSIDTGLYDIVYFGNDGGIRKKSEGQMYCHSITGKNLGVTQFFGFGNSEADDGIMMGGGQDIGTRAYMKGLPEPWQTVKLGDGYTAKFAVNGVKKAFGEVNCSTTNCSLHDMFGKTFTGSTIGSFTVPTPTDTPTSNINRPQYFDPQNTAHVGYSYIWKKPYSPSTSDWGGSAAWERTFQKDPIFYGLPVRYNKVAVDFYIDESNANNAYIAYRDITMDDAGVIRNPANDTFGKLYFSNNATHPTSPSWSNITPAICTTNGMNTIMVDPDNPARIWVGFGNINSDMAGTDPEHMEKRVWYSNAYGASGTWVEVSKGLSALPVNKLLYRKGTNDELYAGTDAGVFKWNRIACQWECFNNGLPPCTVMDMEFNYCAGKLRIATFGRGIWETPLPPIDPADGTPLEITSGTTTWNTNKWLAGTVRIHSGATLIINGSDIHMPAESAIEVQVGGHLIVTNSRLTNDCEGCFWKGVQAWGSISNVPQATATQGWVTLMSSTIEHARVGVCNYNPADSIYEVGGIIQAFSSRFVNNINSAKFLEYHNIGPSGARPNLSHFDNCTFLIDNNYKGDAALQPMRYFVYMRKAELIRFKGCKFMNRDWNSYSYGKGEGILAVNSGVSVTPFCSPLFSTCPTPYRSYFSGLTDGVNIKGIFDGGSACTVDRADFDSCSIGVNVSVHNNVTLTRNHFDVGRGRPTVAILGGTIYGCSQNIGIIVQNSTVFKIEENSFKGRPNTSPYYYAPWTNFGTIVANMNATSYPYPHTNKVYRNSYETIDKGICAVGVNGGLGWGSDVGLSLFCNSFTSNQEDIFVVNDGTIGGSLATWQGIANSQGLGWSPAANTFTTSVKNIVNNSGAFTYAYDGSYPSHYPIPAKVFGGVAVVPVFSGYHNTCPSTLTGTGPYVLSSSVLISTSSVAAYKTAFKDNKNTLLSSIQTYASSIDGGNSEVLLAYIDTVSSSDSLYEKLVKTSPYLSDEALIKMVETQLLSYDQLDSVYEKNPDALRHASVFLYATEFFADAQANSNPPIPDYVSAITAAAGTTSARTTLEQTISSSKAAMDEAGDYIMTALLSPLDTNIHENDSTWAGVCLDSTSVYYMLDSNEIYWGLDSVDTWLQNIGGYSSEYARVGFHYQQKQLGTANNIFNSINPQTMPDDEKAIYDTYDTLWSVLNVAAADGRDEFSLDSSEIEYLKIPAGPIYTFNTARQILINVGTSSPFYSGGWYPSPCTLVYVAKSSANTKTRITSYPNIKNIHRNKNIRVAVYPNPSTGLFTFEYHLPQSVAANEITVSVTNVLGSEVMEQKTVGSEGKLIWDASKLAPGIYIYQVANNEGIIGKGKIVLAK